MAAAKNGPRAKGKTGRPSKLTDERVERILEAIRAGNYIETAARIAGIAPSTLHQWRHDFPDFAEAVEKARAEAEGRNVAIVQRAAMSTWQAAAWWLERSFPARFGRRDRMEVDHSGSVGVTLTQLAKLAGEEEAGDGDS